MKMKLNAVLMLVLGVLAFACKKDNYETPSSRLSGRIVYNGEPIQVEYDRVPFQLFEYGFGKVAPVGTFSFPNGNLTISTFLAQDGLYSLNLYDGEYKFVINPGQGPFMWPQTGGKADSVTINVNGNTTRDIEVMPYYMIRNAAITNSGTTVTANFGLEQIITDANAKSIQEVILYINRTQFVGEVNQLTRTVLAGSAITNPGAISLTATVPAITPAQNHAFARIGVRIAGVEDMLFSPVQRINY